MEIVKKRNGLITDEYGNKLWYKDDLRHREDGPAIIYSTGTKEFYQNDQLHRLDGPAIEYAVPEGYKEWYYQGKRINCSSQEEFEKMLKLQAFW